MNIITVFLIEPATLRLSFDYDPAINERIKTLPGWEFKKQQRMWTVPVSSLDKLIREFGETLAVHPDVFMVASPNTPVMNFAAVLRQAGITLTDIDGRLIGSGGAYCVDPWQRLVDDREGGLRSSGYGSVTTGAKSNVGTATLRAIDSTSTAKPAITLADPRLNDFDRMAARQWGTWKKNQEDEDALIAEAKRKRWGRKMQQPELMEG